MARVNHAPHDDRYAGMVGVKTTLRVVAPAAPAEVTTSHRSTVSSLKDGAPLVYTSSPAGFRARLRARRDRLNSALD